MLACLVLAVLTLVGHPSARAGSITAAAGDVIAKLSYTRTGSVYRDLRIAIGRSGRTLYYAPITSAACSPDCGPAPLGPHQPSLRVLDLDSSGRLDVVLGLYSGGAHCCFLDQVFRYDPATATYAESEHDFAIAGAALRRIDGRYVFLSANNAFYYLYASFAGSGAPIRILTFANGSFIDVTRSYPSLIRANAAAWWRAFSHDYAGGEGFIAAWAADEDLLGNARLVAAALRRELRAGHLHAALPGTPSGRSFITALRRLLAQQGYQR